MLLYRLLMASQAELVSQIETPPISPPDSPTHISKVAAEEVLSEGKVEAKEV